MPEHDLTADTLRQLYAEHGTIRAVGRATGIPYSTIHKMISRAGIAGTRQPEVDELNIDPPRSRSVSSNDPKEWGDVERLLKRRGLRVEDWFIRSARVNEWGAADNLSTQLRVDLDPRQLLPRQVDSAPGWKPPRPGKGERVTGGLVALLGDHHAPHHCPDLHNAVIAWLSEHKPERIVILGDLLDYDQVSRHARTPEWSATLQSTLEAAYNILRAYRAASPLSRIEILDGNHEDRLRNAVLANLPAIHGLRRAGDENSPPVLSTRHLLRLDELNVTYHGSTVGSYDSAQIRLAPNLAARHGWIAKRGSGTSALATINNLRYSVIIGHTHRQSIVYQTAHSIDGVERRLLGAEAGTLARIDGGLGYVPGGSADWQQGFATATICPDGRFTVELAVYASSTLLWRNWRYNRYDPSAP